MRSDCNDLAPILQTTGSANCCHLLLRHYRSNHAFWTSLLKSFGTLAVTWRRECPATPLFRVYFPLDQQMLRPTDTPLSSYCHPLLCQSPIRASTGAAAICCCLSLAGAFWVGCSMLTLAWSLWSHSHASECQTLSSAPLAISLNPTLSRLASASVTQSSSVGVSWGASVSSQSASIVRPKSRHGNDLLDYRQVGESVSSSFVATACSGLLTRRRQRTAGRCCWGWMSRCWLRSWARHDSWSRMIWLAWAWRRFHFGRANPESTGDLYPVK